MLAIAGTVGATDLEINDTVLIAAGFSMYNRYVDGLGSWQPQDHAMYTEIGEHLAKHTDTSRRPSLRRSKADARKTAHSFTKIQIS